MGCFDYTCMISGLPIGAGDAVKYLLLVESKYKDNIRCYPYSDWNLRVPAVNASYNDYGSVEYLEEGDPDVKIMFGMWHDVVELGVGDNTCHDVAVSVDMSIPDRLEAIWEGRLSVSADIFNTSEKKHDEHPGFPGQPSMKRLQSQIANKEFVIDEIHPGMVRIRAEFGQSKKLNKVIKALGKEYEYVKTCGSGSNVYEMQVLVFPKPIDSKHEGSVPLLTFHTDKINPLAVRQSMVLKEVWDYLVKLPFEVWDKKTRKGAFEADIYNPMWTFWQENKLEGNRPFFDYKNDFVEQVFGCSLGFKYMRNAWDYALTQDWSEEDQAKWVRSFCETVKFEISLSSLRIMLDEGHTCGAQHGGYPRHAKFAEFVMNLANEKEKRYDE